MRILTILACGALAACTSGAVTVPSENSVITEVPAAGNASSYGGGDFTSTISNALDENGQPTQLAVARVRRTATGRRSTRTAST